MPNRILKESICTSETIEGLSIEAEAFFYRLMVRCDDFGRMDARPSILRAGCFPLRLDRITDDQVGAWLTELEKADLLWIYQSEGRPYLQVTKWDKHQQKRAKHSKYPQPPERASNCNQMPADDSNSPRGIESRETRVEESTHEESAGAAMPPGVPVQTKSAATQPAVGGSRAQSANSMRETLNTLEQYFSELTGLPVLPARTNGQKDDAAARSWAPLTQIYKLCAGDLDATKRLLAGAVGHMRAHHLTIGAPKSVLSVAARLHAETKGQRHGRDDPAAIARMTELVKSEKARIANETSTHRG